MPFVKAGDWCMIRGAQVEPRLNGQIVQALGIYKYGQFDAYRLQHGPLWRVQPEPYGFKGIRECILWPLEKLPESHSAEQDAWAPATV